MLLGSNQTTRNIAMTWGHKVAYIFASLFITGIATRAYGLAEMGIWLLATTIASYIALFDFGASSALPRTLPKLLREGRFSEASQIVSSALLVSIVAALIGMVLLVFAGEGAVNLLLASNQMGSTHYHILLVTVIIALLGLPLRVGYGLLASKNRFDVYFGVDLLGVLARVFLVFLVVAKWEAGILAFAFVAILPPLFANMAQFYYGSRHANVAISLSNFSHKSLAELASHTGASLVLTFSTMLLAQGSSLVAAKLGTAAVAALAIPLMLVTQAMSFSGSLGALVTPVASHLSADMGSGLARLTSGIISVSISMSTPIVLVLCYVGPEFVQWWLGVKHDDQATMDDLIHGLQLLAVGAICIGPAAAARGILLGAGKHWHTASSDLVGAIIGFFSGLLMLNTTIWGVLALASGVVIGFAMRFLSAVLMLVLTLRLRSHELFIAIVAPMTLFVVSFCLPLLIDDMPGAYSGLAASFMQLTFGMSIWAIGTWSFVLTPAMRNKLLKRHKDLFQDEK